MTQPTIFDPAGRAVPYIEEGEGPIGLVLLTTRDLEADGLGVIAHYLAEEAGFRIVRIAVSDSHADAAASVAAVMDHLELEDAWIGGHGAGGTVARAFAASRTDRANGLLLLAAEHDETPLAPAIPVLIVQGTDDDVMPPANGEALQATAPERASIKTIPGAGHLFPVTHPIETAVIIEEYLDWD